MATPAEHGGEGFDPRKPHKGAGNSGDPNVLRFSKGNPKGKVSLNKKGAQVGHASTLVGLTAERSRDGKKIIGMARYVPGSEITDAESDAADLGTYIAIEGQSNSLFLQAPLVDRAPFDVYVVHLRQGHIDPEYPDAEPTVVEHRERLLRGTFTNAVGAFNHGKEVFEKRTAERARLAEKRTAEINALHNTYNLPEQLERNTLSQEERRTQLEQAREARQRELDAIVVVDNDHEWPDPDFIRTKGYVAGEVFAVEPISYGMDDQTDGTLYTYLEARAKNAPPYNQVPVSDKTLLYNVDLVTVSFIDVDADGNTTTPDIRVDRVPLIQEVSISTADRALKLGKDAIARREAETALVEAKFTAIATQLEVEKTHSDEVTQRVSKDEEVSGAWHILGPEQEDTGRTETTDGRTGNVYFVGSEGEIQEFDTEHSHRDENSEGRDV